MEVIVSQQQVSVTFFALLVADDRRATCQRIFGKTHCENARWRAIEWSPYGFSDSSDPVVIEQDAQLTPAPIATEAVQASTRRPVNQQQNYKLLWTDFL